MNNKRTMGELTVTEAKQLLKLKKKIDDLLSLAENIFANMEDKDDQDGERQETNQMEALLDKYLDPLDNIDVRNPQIWSLFEEANETVFDYKKIKRKMDK